MLTPIPSLRRAHSASDCCDVGYGASAAERAHAHPPASSSRPEYAWSLSNSPWSASGAAVLTPASLPRRVLRALPQKLISEAEGARRVPSCMTGIINGRADCAMRLLRLELHVVDVKVVDAHLP